MLYIDAVDLFLNEYQATDRSPETIRIYRDCFKRFQKDTGIVHLKEFTKPLVVKWLKDLRERGSTHPNTLGKPLSKATLWHYHAHMKVFANWCMEQPELQEFLKYNPFNGLPSPKFPRKEGVTTISYLEFQQLLKVAGTGPNGYRDKVMLRFLMSTGCRAGELVTLTFERVNFKHCEAEVTGKSGTRTVFFDRTTGRMLRYYISRYRKADRIGNTYVFTTRDGHPFKVSGLSLHVRRLMKRAGVTARKLGPHTLRHTFATNFQGNTLELMALLGHSSTQMTERYHNPTEDQLREIARKRSVMAKWNL